jgi:hypothetical protein
VTSSVDKGFLGQSLTILMFGDRNACKHHVIDVPQSGALIDVQQACVDGDWVSRDGQTNDRTDEHDYSCDTRGHGQLEILVGVP